ncbi:putative disease resistance protein RGA4 [Daucus carota subsp. sativus]|uniref:putative disease resistance protein RGA4 n=1 Tax=Daucus carota subsp. sativus TaxID=79200 RepID=UPI003083C382
MPKDSDIYKDELVQIWMALGFLFPPLGSNMLMEDFGNEYFNILLWNSLLQEVERDAFGNIKRCKMHDLVHDLAQDLSKHHSLTVKAGHDQFNHISQAMYVRVDEGVLDIKPQKNFERVQILFAGTRILADVLPYLKRLTVLVLNADGVTNKLPSSLGKMKYLKHLDISCSRYRLPSYITELYNLQTLRVWDLDELPKKFCNLINLRHLYIENAYSQRRCVFTGIGRLTCIQTLPHFVVSKDKMCLVRQLGGLKNLRGKLELYGLGDIDNMEEASMASLHTKPNIERLKLVWRNKEDVMEKREYNDEDVMEGLKPHTNLLELTIINFMGRKFASWITMMTNLVKVTLRNCKRCEVFPQLGHLPKLREMDINGMDALRVIGSHFYGGLGRGSSEFSESCTTIYPSLTRLILWDLPKLEEWLEPLVNTYNEEQGPVQVFPKLEVLEIVSCSKLRRIPKSCFLSLKELEIKNLDSSKILETMSTKLSSLTNLRLTNISDGDGGCSSSKSNMDSVLEELLKNSSLTLTNLKLDHCQGLTCLTFSLFVALDTLKVVDCPNLTSINVIKELSALNHLISECPNLKEGNWMNSLYSNYKLV